MATWQNLVRTELELIEGQKCQDPPQSEQDEMLTQQMLDFLGDSGESMQQHLVDRRADILHYSYKKLDILSVRVRNGAYIVVTTDGGSQNFDNRAGALRLMAFAVARAISAIDGEENAGSPLA